MNEQKVMADPSLVRPMMMMLRCLSVATLDNESKVKFYDGNNPTNSFGNVMGIRQWVPVPTF